jgi:hypothetical protein
MAVTAGAMLYLLMIIAVITIVMILPLQIAASAMGARRTGVIWCFLSLLAAGAMQGIALAAFPVAGNIVAFLLSALVFAALLDTTFIRGVGITLLYFVFSVILVFLLTMILTFFGVSLGTTLL